MIFSETKIITDTYLFSVKYLIIPGLFGATCLYIFCSNKDGTGGDDRIFQTQHIGQKPSAYQFVEEKITAETDNSFQFSQRRSAAGINCNDPQSFHDALNDVFGK